ncbi:MAG TPA: decaprenyl-phosphate phosphoribosyltransferase [Cyclobacteriaceae bacterium]|nr:decaprenyl-phosphate phosphoribosyltransferase [Cyclobacteriaceae bacterium]
MTYLRLLRVHQWAKNLFLFVPLFFAGQIFEYSYYQTLAMGFLAFGLSVSAVYVFNDFCDRESDRLHPKKKYRAIASGAVSVTQAVIIMVVLVVAGLSVAFSLNTVFFTLLCVYVGINVLYSLGLKNFAIIDIFFISSGFILRIYSGGALTSTPISHWLAVMVLLLSLFMALAKRRDELIVNQQVATKRKSLEHYNLDFVNSCITLFGSVIIVSYILYTVSPEVIARFGTDWLFLTSIFVIAGVVRYLQIIFVEENGGSPTAILYKDKFIIGTIVAWVLAFYIILYVS